MTTLSIGKFQEIMKETDSTNEDALIKNTQDAQIDNEIENQIKVFEDLLDRTDNKITKLGDRMLAQMATLYLIKTYNDLADNKKTEFDIDIHQHYSNINPQNKGIIFSGLNDSDFFDNLYEKLSGSNQLDAKKELKLCIKENTKEFAKVFNKALKNYIDGFAQESRVDLKSKDSLKQKDRQKARLKDIGDKNLRLLQRDKITGLQKEIDKIESDINTYTSNINQIKREQNDRDIQEKRLGTNHVQKYQPVDNETKKNENALISQLNEDIRQLNEEIRQIRQLEKSIKSLEGRTMGNIKTPNPLKQTIEANAIAKGKPPEHINIIQISKRNQEISKNQDKEDDDLLVYDHQQMIKGSPLIVGSLDESTISCSQRSQSLITRQAGEQAKEILAKEILSELSVLKKETQKNKNTMKINRNNNQKGCFSW